MVRVVPGGLYDFYHVQFSDDPLDENAFNETELELIKPMKTNYILVYDTQRGDPVEYFETLSDAENRIQALVKENGVVLDSIKIYEVKSVGAVKGIKVEIKFEK